MSVIALHGALGQPGDWRRVIASGLVGLQAVDLFSSEFITTTRGGDLMSTGRRIAERWGKSGSNVLTGYSMGGRLALHALVCGNARWRGAVIIAAHPGLVTEAARHRRLAADALWARKLEQMDPDGFYREWNRQPVFASDTRNAGQARFVLHSWKRFGRMATCFGRWSLGAQASLWRHLLRIDTPVTWIVGERDQKFVRVAERAVSLLPRGRLVSVAGCGHRLLEEAPKVVAREIAALA